MSKTNDEMKNEFEGSLFEAYSISALAEMLALEAFDALEDGTSYFDNRRIRAEAAKVKWNFVDVRSVILDFFVGEVTNAWLVDFTNAIYRQLDGHFTKLVFAIGNRLGRIDVQDRNSLARMIVAQSLALDQSDFIKRRTQHLRHCKVQNRHGNMVSVSGLFSKMSCKRAGDAMMNISRLILSPVTKEDFSFRDETIFDGIDAIEKTLGNIRTWEKARDRADELNGLDTKKE